MLWGTYRPNLYCGIKTRSESPINFGLLWFEDEQISKKEREKERKKEKEKENIIFMFKKTR